MTEESDFFLPERHKILVVDDQQENIDHLCHVLSDEYDILEATNGLAAIKLAKQMQPALIMLDVNMPVMSGYDVCRKLRASPDTRDIPIIFVSALDAEEDESYGFEIGASDYVSKPLSIPIVLRRVKHQIELKKSLDSLEEFNEQLEFLVAARTEELEDALSQAREMSRLKDSFLSTMTHELRTPLNGIIGSLDLMEKDGLSEANQDSYKAALFSANQMNRLISSILDYVELQAKQLKLVYEPFSIKKLIDEITTGPQKVAKGKGLEFNCSVDYIPKHHVMGDFKRIHQILVNILYNAVKFTDSGSVDLNIKISDKVDGYTLMSCHVTDTGRGMSDSDKFNIFEPFRQIDDSYSRKIGGLGIGLNIAQSLCQQMNAHISLESELGKGTDFNVTFKFDNSTEEPEEEKQVPFDASGKVILVAEDNPVNQMVTCRMLKSLGFETISAENGKIAWETTKEQKPDMIFMDIQMPEMDGFEATKRIRAMYPMDALPIIAVTANIMSFEREHFNISGVQDYIAKPLKKDVVCKMLSKWLFAN